MDTSYITRPFRRLQSEMDVEELPVEQEYHAPYLHESCQQCEDSLLHNFNEGGWENESELLQTINEAYFNDEEIDSFAVYRHFHPFYDFNRSPYESIFTPIGLPGKGLRTPLRVGDIVLVRSILSGKTQQAIITNPDLVTGEGDMAHPSNSSKPGYYAEVYGNLSGHRNQISYVRITDGNKRVLNNVLLLRKSAPDEILKEDSPENYLSEAPPDYKEYNLKYVKYGKGGGYMYAGDRSVDYEAIFREANLSETEVKMARHFLETEGGIDSINTYDNQVITWGFGFAGKSGNLTIALFNLFSRSSAAKSDFNSFGITLNSENKSSLSISSEEKTYTADDALAFWKLSKKYLNILIYLTQKHATDTFLAQWETFKRIHKQVFTAFSNDSYLGNIHDEIEKNKSKTAILHAHHHYPAFNPPASFKDASSFEEVLKIYVDQSSRYGSVQGHANAWRKSINRIFNNNAPPVPPVPIIPPAPKTSTTVLTGSVGKEGRNNTEDVAKIQQLLNAVGIAVPVSGRIDNKEGDITILAIYYYQKKKNLPAYDGRVDVNGSTIKSLIKDAKASGAESEGIAELDDAAMVDEVESPPPIVPASTTPPIEQTEWAAHTNINARYGTWQAYKAVRDQVVRWGIGNPAAYIESAIQEWNANPGIYGHFSRNFDGDPHRSYLNLRRLYQARGITDPAGYFNANIVSISFFNRTTPGHRDLQTALLTAQLALTGAGHNFSLDRGTWSFVPRTFNNNINSLSNHALGKAIDINPGNNPHITSREEILVIDAVCRSILTRGLLAETDPDVLRNASQHFQQSFNDAWVAQQTQPNVVSAVTRRRASLNRYANQGFINLPSTLIRGLLNAGLNWGGSWRSAKDFMHFELRNP